MTEQEFKIIYNKWWYHIKHIVRANLIDKDIANDITQEIFIDVFSNTKVIKNIKHYLSRTAKLRAINYNKIQLNRQRLISKIRIDSIVEYSNDEEAISKLDKLLDSWPNNQRKVFIFINIVGKSLTETAEQLGLKLQTVYNLATFGNRSIEKHFNIQLSINKE